jgi:hypothetical protein
MSEHRFLRRRLVDRVIDQLRRADSPSRADREPRGVRGLREHNPTAPWLAAPGRDEHGTQSIEASGRNPGATSAPTHHRTSGADSITGLLKEAHTKTQMDVAILGEVCDGREVVRYLAGDGGSFGLNAGASMPIEDTYCHRLLTGRLSNVVADVQADEQVRDLEITRAAQVGAYIGVPLTGPDARLYVLCCLAHEQRPHLGGRDVRFLRDLGQVVLSTLE